MHNTASTAEQISPVATKPTKQSATASKASSGGHNNNSFNMLPQLKQKTGIVKSKVPPPVPPRGSPKERQRSGNHNVNSINSRFKMGAAAETSAMVRDDKNAGSQNVNTSRFCKPPIVTQVSGADPIDDDDDKDYYTPDGVEIVPKFGARRSPSCVDDWLELNHLHNAKTNSTAAVQIRIQTKCLQREISFPAVKPLCTVPSMIQSFSSPTFRLNSKESGLSSSRYVKTNQNCLELENLRKASSVSKLLATKFKDETQKTNTPRSKHDQTTTIVKRTIKRRAPCPEQMIHQRCT